MKKISKIIDNGLCLGCGLCKSLHPEKSEMKINSTGFYYPEFNFSLSKHEEKQILQLCPAVNVSGEGKAQEWGPILKIKEAWAKDEDIRFHAASGGVTTAIAIFLLESKTVDAILQVGQNENDYLHNSLKVSQSVSEIKECSQSRYAPALVFDRIFEILNGNPNKRYAFIGKPCDIATIRNIQRKYPEYKEQIKICISIFCAGMPSYNATIKTWKLSGHQEEPYYLRYRGDGWPGYFTAKWHDKTEFKLSYNESWGKILGRSLGMRCKVCPDGIGELADIAIGDSWSTKNGFPDFTEQPGRCFVMIRTLQGLQVYNESFEHNYIEDKSLDISKISEVQPYQAQRRKLTLWRLIPLQIKTGFILKFKRLGIIKLGMKAGLLTASKTFIGSCKRVF